MPGTGIGMPEQVSWLVLENGWSVDDVNGTEVGEVTEVIGDQEADIFDGLRVETANGKERYIPADVVARIETGRVELGVASSELPARAEGPGGEELRRDRSAEL